jgi:hypothetical protein
MRVPAPDVICNNWRNYSGLGGFMRFFDGGQLSRALTADDVQLAQRQVGVDVEEFAVGFLSEAVGEVLALLGHDFHHIVQDGEVKGGR